MYCVKCGSQMDDTAIMCPACGAPTDNYKRNKKEKPKSSTTRLVLGIISCVLFILITFQSCAVGLGNALEGNGESSGFAGLMLALCMLAAGIVGICTKRTKGGGIAAGLIYAFGGLIGISNVGAYADLEIWSYLAFLLAVVFIASSIKIGRSNKNEKSPVKK